MLKRLVKTGIARAVGAVSETATGKYAFQRIASSVRGAKTAVTYRSHRMQFLTPNELNKYRADSFATKEPDTLAWIDTLPPGCVLWDIGANIGLYSVYAAKARNCEVYAFEPSVYNLELLAGNLHLNGVHDRVTIVPIALSAKSGIDTFRMSNVEPGGALSSFGATFDQTGQPLRKVLEYRLPGMTARDAIAHLGIPAPEHLKIDVDGIEHFILRGCGPVLHGVTSVLIEISDAFEEQAAEASRLLSEAGLTMSQKIYLGAVNQFNQLWVRAGADHGGPA
ncbi:MAG TPA: FkbM family methyltransferase [Gemmatimonadaceae bacterium]|nr:FkbM family methyltransferase [Gemmatimonadaceae bacterium]